MFGCGPMQEVVVPLLTDLAILHLSAGPGLAITELGIAVISLMPPCAIQAHCATIGFLHQGHPFIDSKAAESCAKPKLC